MDIPTVARWTVDAERITVLTGAGISTDSGIPDFRGPDGVWTKDPEAARLVTLDAYVTDPDVRRRSWSFRRDHPAWTARPNAAHQALVELERAGKLHAIVTQNIDGLHQRAGSAPDRVIEVHGTLFAVVCLDCGDRTTMTEALDRVAAGEPDPPCVHCGGMLKSATILEHTATVEPDRWTGFGPGAVGVGWTSRCSAWARTCVVGPLRTLTRGGGRRKPRRSWRAAAGRGEQRTRPPAGPQRRPPRRQRTQQPSMCRPDR